MLSLPTTAGTKSLAEGRYFLNSVPVGVPQRESTQRTFALGSKSQGATATGNIYCRSQIYKKNHFFPEDTFTKIQGFVV